MSSANIVLSAGQKTAGADRVLGWHTSKSRAVPPSGVLSKIPADLGINYGAYAIDHSTARGAWVFTTANSGESIAADETVRFDGEPAMKFTLPTSLSVSIAKYTPTNPISLKNFFALELAVRVPICDTVYNIGYQSAGPLQYWLVTTSAKQIRLRMQMGQTEPDGTKVFRWTRDQSGSTYDVSPAGTTWADLDTSTVAYIQVVYYGNSATSAPPAGTAFWFSKLRVNSFATPIVSLRFDHGLIGVYNNIKSYLKTKNLAATFYPIHTRNQAGGTYMTYAQLDEMYADGHEIGLHHYDPKTAVTGYGIDTVGFPTSASITDDINTAWAVNRARGWYRGIGLICEGFSGNYFGGTTAAARQQLVKQGMDAAGVRHMVSLNSGWPMLNSPAPWRGNKCKLSYATVTITASTTQAQVQAAIDSAIAYRQWLIILMHDIVDDATTPAGNQMTASNAKIWMDYLTAKVLAGSCVCLPIGEVVDQMG